ncbi:glycosyltransferase [Paenibacillus chartarius]|uniref:Glycosyltransferase n=1 Tax=Paenibacillus chartarius TaxID=747481 RepID=A0ABV6DPJ4_9BACL
MSAGSKYPPGVSIITCTNRPSFMENLFKNYKRQRHARKELIIVVNKDKASLLPYQQLAKKDKSIQVYRLPERHSLGSCLNFAVSRTKYDYIAKFDDDDYYAPYYVKDGLQAFQKSNADIVGKKSHYMYLSGSKTVLLRFPGCEYRYETPLPGATLMVKRHVFSKVRFPDQSIGEDDDFCKLSKKQGYKVYSAGKHNFIAIRRKDTSSHTWTISDKTLIAHHRIVPNVKDYKRFVRKKP